MKEIISKNGDLIAIIVERDFAPKKFNFITPDDYPLQMGINYYKKGERINPHHHLHIERVIDKIQEVVYIQKGKASVDIYDLDNKKLKTEEISAGDIIFFADGGHGFNLVEDTKIIEVKQGPYMGRNMDKKEIK